RRHDRCIAVRDFHHPAALRYGRAPAAMAGQNKSEGQNVLSNRKHALPGFWPGAAFLCQPVMSQIEPSGDVMSAFEFPPEFRTPEGATNGPSTHGGWGGRGPAVVLLHGYGETGDMWVPLAVDLARDRTVVVPDLRGLGLSSKPAGGFDKKTQAGD